MKDGKRVIALGFFDGVHQGHGALLRRVAQQARNLQAIPAVFTFRSHPESVITGTQVPLINSPDDRVYLIRSLYGIEDVIMSPFDHSVMKMPWEAFVTECLAGRMKAIHVVAGHDFRFGYKGEGNPQRLKEKCAQLGLGCEIVERVELEGVTVSSTHIRTLIAQGEIERANAFLGHPHLLTDTVAHGKKLGSTLGFPTINLHFPPHVIAPAYGVYACRAVLPDGQTHLAVTNVGVRPTVEEGGRPTIESFLLDFEGDLYGQEVRLEFCHFLRPEQKFFDIEALRTQIIRDVEKTKAYFAEIRETVF